MNRNLCTDSIKQSTTYSRLRAIFLVSDISNLIEYEMDYEKFVTESGLSQSDISMLILKAIYSKT